MFVGEWMGRVKVFSSVEDTTPTLAVDVTTEVHSFGDRGMLGMKLDPQFGTEGHNFIYLGYAYDQAMGSATAPKAEFPDNGGDFCKNEAPWTDCLISGRVVRVELDPTTGVASAGAVEPPQQELVRSWCQQFNSHSMGDLEFDSTGALLISAGEGANYATADYGQFENPCGDPLNAGGSLRSQDVRSDGDQTDYSGSVIRVDPATGDALPDNPLYGISDARAHRILAYGFRNPYRFEIRPGTSEIYVGDVGQSLWEELDRFSSAPGQPARNFGWPCYEGANGTSAVMGKWKTVTEEGHAPLCQELYETPSLVTAPIWAYGHGTPAGYLFAGDACNPAPGAALSGLSFYDPSGVAPDWVYPSQYHGTLFMADAARGCIWAMQPGLDGKPDPSKIANFATPGSGEGISPVDIVQGPDGALYAPNFYQDTITQIRFVGNNQPPTAQIVASKIDGPIGAGFDVTFDASDSDDPEGDTRHFAWDLDGDGAFDDGADEPTAERTYNTPTNVVVKVRVSDDLGRSDIAELTIYPGDEGPPEPIIESPSPDLGYAVGETIAYKGSATDPDDGALSGGDLQWTISIQHCPDACHTHPYAVGAEGASGTFTVPPHDEPSHLRFELTATDSRNRSVTVGPRDVFPRVAAGGGGSAPPVIVPPPVVQKVRLTIASRPPGIKVRAGKVRRRAPFSLRLAKGRKLALRAPAKAVRKGRDYVFRGWLVKGKLKKTPALSVVGRSNARYVAVYAAD